MTLHDSITEAVIRYRQEAQPNKSTNPYVEEDQRLRRLDEVALITQTIARLIDDGHLQQPDPGDLPRGLSDQVRRLRELTASTNEATKWLAAVNHLIMSGTTRDELLKAETDQNGDWQGSSTGDLRKGDQAKAVFQNGAIIQGTVRRVLSNGDISLGEGVRIHADDDITLYRIPKPVVHPDPAEHPVIIVNEAQGNNSDDLPREMIWFMGSYVSGMTSFIPEIITDWEPAKVVADDDR
jgi:hypothetical protein